LLPEEFKRFGCFPLPEEITPKLFTPFSAPTVRAVHVPLCGLLAMIVLNTF